MMGSALPPAHTAGVNQLKLSACYFTREKMWVWISELPIV